MKFDVLLCYMYVGIVCAFVITIVRNRSNSTIYKETVDKSFSLLCVFFIVFCILDALWGIAGSPSAGLPRILFVILSYIFHFMAATSSLATAIYSLKYFGIQNAKKKIFIIYRNILYVCQLAFVIQNIFTSSFFSVDGEGIYHSNSLRYVSFYLQMLQYLPFIINSTIILAMKKERGNKYYNLSGTIYLSIILIFCLLQMFYPDGPFYSLGFMVTAVSIYAFNVTSSRENYLKEYHTMQSEQKSREEIEEALRKAEAANSAKTVFLSNMSHDIRTPINGIMGMATIALKEDMPDSVRKCINQINDASKHLLSLINDVLDMSKIESGKITISNDEIDLIEVSNLCCTIIEGQLANREVNFTHNFDDVRFKYVEGDALYLKQIFINILGNSVKFTRDGGDISFDITEVSNDESTVTYRFIFKDTGIGMKEDFLKKLYEPFSQEERTSRSTYVGTGLGMSITKKLVDFMGGTIKVESEFHVGTTFTIDLPFKKVLNKIEEEKNIVDVQNKTLKGLNILVCEDNDLNLEIVKNILESEGVNVSVARNGDEGYKAFIDSYLYYYDCVLMDVMMPKMNGLDTTRMIRLLNRDDARTVPIIAMTANAFDEDRKACLESGMDSYVSKPIDFECLFKEIKKLV